MNNAISLINVSKKFRLYNAPHERLIEAFHPFKKKYHREFWALRDINLEIPQGTTLGIIGRNGSGKSTLLQIICSVLSPTSGEVSINGRVSALLELGADFHPDFTGRENVIQKGIRMGFTEKEMLSKLSEIEEFADIGEFINQPVKIYSSGMFLRLAFSTAINVDPDILVVDEALAVGDAKFQHKCYQKFTEFQEKGKTIIFVTHNMDAVVRHCEKAVLLENGGIIYFGEPKLAVSKYLELLFVENIIKKNEQPILIEEGYRSFNIVKYMDKYFALSNSLGQLDLTQMTQGDLDNLIKIKKCVIDGSINDIKREIEVILEPNSTTFTKSDIIYQSELEKFINTPSSKDNCPNRRNYNKNEYKYGNKRIEIVDYLIISDEEYDPLSIVSGSNVEIYIKAYFYENVDKPIFGISIKTKDGIALYGTNTSFIKKNISPAQKGDVMILKFSQILNLQGGDYFIDLGVSSKNKFENIEPEDRRLSIIHLKIINEKKYIFGGFFDFETVIEELNN